jgi:hypothetical protein
VVLGRLGWLVAGSAVVGVIVGIVGLLADRHGTVGGLLGTLLVGQPPSFGLCVALALVCAPVFGWYGLSLALGVPTAVSGNALHLSAHRTVTIDTAARAAPLLAFAPVVAAAVVLTLAALGGRRGALGHARSRGWWARWIAMHAVGFAVVGLVMRSVSVVGMQRVVSAAPDEVGSLAPVLWASAVVPALWGVIIAVVLPQRAVSHAANRPRGEERAS